MAGLLADFSILSFSNKKDNGSSTKRLGRDQNCEIAVLDVREESKVPPPKLKYPETKN